MDVKISSHPFLFLSEILSDRAKALCENANNHKPPIFLPGSVGDTSERVIYGFDRCDEFDFLL